MRQVFALLEADEEVKLAKGEKSLAQVLRRGGFEIWESPALRRDHRGAITQSLAVPSVGKLEINRYAGWDFTVSAGLGSRTPVDDKDRQKATALTQRARDFLTKQGFQVADYRPQSDIMFVVKGKR
jgi:hypothetical protein